MQPDERERRGLPASRLNFRARVPWRLACAIFGLVSAMVHGQTPTDSPEPVPLAELLEKIRVKYRLPALAAAAVVEEKVVAHEAVGRRNANEPVPVTADDQWHIGSCTKSMTATLAAMLVEDGKISWATRIDDVFSEWADTMEPAWHHVSLENLLAHRGGVPAEPPENLWRNAWRATGTPTEQRLEFVRGLLLRRPVAKPGEKFIYSNQGYAIAGAMLEKATGRAWEDLLRERLFTPLDMTSAGFGAPGDVKKIDQPWGHVLEGGQPQPMPPGKAADNPAAIGPAGTVHCSISDLARFAGWHARSIRTTARILGPESFARLHTPPPGGEYALGWVVTQRSWADGTALMHNGSNTMWYAVMWLAPAKDTAFVAATNIAGEEAEKGCDEAVATLLRRTLK
jgi:CubicO group peptidase (beta-lactamase class C family)